MNIVRGKKANYSLPKCGLIMGAPKVGKSTWLAKDERTLILDLEPVSENAPEEGAYYGIDVKGGYSHIESIADLNENLGWFYGEDNDEFDMVAIDQVRELTSMYSKEITSMAGVQTVQDIGYGKGTAQLRHEIETFIKLLIKKSTTKKRSIIVAHANDRNGEVRLDVDGKNESMIFSMVDYVGYLYKSGTDLHINFTQSTGSEYGCRNKYLAGYKGKADWDLLKRIASGTTA